jgi:hypothetical protein
MGISNTLTTLDSHAKFDEFGIWNRILSSTEAAELYNSGNGLFYGTGYSKKFNGVSAYTKVNGIPVANIRKINGIQ